MQSFEVSETYLFYLNFYPHSLEVDKNVDVEVKSSTELSKLYYVVIGRTGILENKAKDFSKNEHEYKFSFKASSWMVPEAQILIYYIHHSGEIVYDRVSMSFDVDLPNNVSDSSFLTTDIK